MLWWGFELLLERWIAIEMRLYFMAVAGGPAGPALPDQFSEERMRRNALSLSIEYTTRDTYNSDQLSVIVVLYRWVTPFVPFEIFTKPHYFIW